MKHTEKIRKNKIFVTWNLSVFILSHGICPPQAEIFDEFDARNHAKLLDFTSGNVKQEC